MNELVSPSPSSPMPSNPSAGDLLRSVLAKRMAKNPSYSLRAFARDLEISHTYLSLVINGKKKLSRQKALRFAEVLGASGELNREALASAYDDYYNLKEEQFQVLNQWYHLPILDLTLTENFQPDIDWIARRLGIKPTQVQDAVDRLEKLGLLKNWRKQAKRLDVTTFQSHEAVRAFHSQMIQKAMEALKSPQQNDFEFREISGAVMTVNPKRLPEVKQKIKAFKKKLIDWLGGEEGTELFQLNLQFFSLTRPPFPNADERKAPAQ